MQNQEHALKQFVKKNVLGDVSLIIPLIDWNKDESSEEAFRDLFCCPSSDQRAGEEEDYAHPICFYTITRELYNHLKERGTEPVHHFGGSTFVWGRQAFGQPIMLDFVIRDIFKEVQSANMIFYVKVTIRKEEVAFDNESEEYYIDCENIEEEDTYSFEELLDVIKGYDYCWGRWSDSKPQINGSSHSSWLTSHEEKDFSTGSITNYTLHFDPVRGVNLNESQIKMIEKTLKV